MTHFGGMTILLFSDAVLAPFKFTKAHHSILLLVNGRITDSKKLCWGIHFQYPSANPLFLILGLV